MMGNKNDKRPIIIFIDEEENFKARIEEGSFDPSEKIFKSCNCIEDVHKLNGELRKIKDKNSNVIIYVHAFRNRPNWFQVLYGKIVQIEFSGIKKEFIKIVTTDEAHKVKEKFPWSDVDRYNDIMKKVVDENYIKKTVAEILGVERPDSIENKKSHRKNYIFISHAAKDKKIADLFFEKILKLGLSVPKEQIFFSSDYESGLKTSDDITFELKNALFEMNLFIQFISDNYAHSEVCLNEMGAAWIQLERKYIITFLISPTSFDKIGFINANKIGLKLDDEQSFYRLLDEYKDIFEIYKPTLGGLQKQINSFMTELPAIIKV